MYDQCEDCGHTWHGLPCEYQHSQLNDRYQYTVSEKCKCPSSFKEK